MIPPMQYGGVLYGEPTTQFVSIYKDERLMDWEIQRILEPFGLSRAEALFTSDLLGVYVPVVPWLAELIETYYFFDSKNLRTYYLSNWEHFEQDLRRLRQYYNATTGADLPGHIKTGLAVGLGYHTHLRSHPKAYVPIRPPKARRMPVPLYLERHYEATFG